MLFRSVDHKRVDLLEAVPVEKHLEALPGRQFSLLVLFLDALLSPAEERLRSEVAEILKFMFPVLFGHA